MVVQDAHVAPPLPGVELPSAALSRGLGPAAFPLHPPEQIALTIPLVDDDRLVLAVVPADAPLSLAKVRDALRAPGLRRATLVEARRALPGVEPSAIPPFGALLGVPAVVDRRLLTYNRVVCSDGTHGGRRLVDAGDLLRLGRARTADLCCAGAPSSSGR